MRVRLGVDIEVSDTVALAELVNEQPPVTIVVTDRPGGTADTSPLYGRIMSASPVESI